MQRSDREITDQTTMDAILHEASVCRLGLSNGAEPYIVPLCYGYDGSAVYLHSAVTGKKIDLIKQNPSCCVEVDLFEGLVRRDSPCSWGMHYRSVICTGTASILSDPHEKVHGLNCILHHYGREAFEFSDEILDSVTVVKITIREMTGKQCVP